MKLSRYIVFTNSIDYSTICIYINMDILNAYIWADLVNEQKHIDIKSNSVTNTLFAFCVCKYYGNILLSYFKTSGITLKKLSCNVLNNNLIISYKCGCSVTKNILKVLANILSSDINKIRDSYKTICAKYNVTYSSDEFDNIRNHMYKNISIFIIVNDSSVVDKSYDTYIGTCDDVIIYDNIFTRNDVDKSGGKSSDNLDDDKKKTVLPHFNLNSIEAYLLHDFFNHVKIPSRLKDNTVIVDDETFTNDYDLDSEINSYLIRNFGDNINLTILTNGMTNVILDLDDAIDLYNKLKKNNTENIKNIYNIITNAYKTKFNKYSILS